MHSYRQIEFQVVTSCSPLDFILGSFSQGLPLRGEQVDLKPPTHPGFDLPYHDTGYGRGFASTQHFINRGTPGMSCLLRSND